ncbi:MAG TPA: CvpA family protein [Verrucomicrobiae bacterium]|nr:CvpA family protein [Verrucomicrobiae bacterium]
MNLHNLPINMFDCVLIAVLTLGLLAGRKHGMSEELMSLLKWLAVLIGCAIVYEPAGLWFAQASPFSLLASFLMAYILGALLILGAFSFIKHQLGGKLIGSDIFGRSEYYLGMGSGMVRAGCMLLVGLALLNARYFSPAEVQAMDRFQNDMYGSNYFPTLHSAQQIVFEESVAGPWIRDHFGFLLIKPTEPEDKQFHQKEANLP